MDELSRIRKEKHNDFLRANWLPEFFKKYREIFENKKIISMQRLIRKNILFEVINEDIVNFIPGLFRKRIKLTEKNLVRPVTDLVKKNNIPKPIIDDDNIQNAIKESEKEYNENFEKELSKILEKSIQDNNFVDYDDYILNQVVEDSYKIIDNTPVGSPNLLRYENLKMGVCLDLRIYGPDPYQPIIIFDTHYYLNNEQIKEIKKIWNKINPATNAGIIYKQNLEFAQSKS